MHLAPPIHTYFTARAPRDGDALAVAFAPEAIVHDEGRSHQATFDWQAARDSVVGRMCTGLQTVDAQASLATLPIAEADLGIPWNWRIGPAGRPVSDETYVAQAFTPARIMAYLRSPHAWGRHCAAQRVLHGYLISVMASAAQNKAASAAGSEARVLHEQG